jgi:phenylalanine-4-hydroxylase
MKQDMNAYTAEDFQVWKTLFDRQVENLQTKGSSHYLSALKEMESVLNRQLIPDFRAINGFFQDATGWSIEVVPGLIPVEQFFELLADKKFCSSTWLRTMEQLDYLEEPDMFHDVFGHVPLLSNKAYTSFFEAISHIAIEYIDNPKIIELLGRVYWFTIEFGLIRENDKLRIFGAGIISSSAETENCLSDATAKHDFNVNQILNTSFRTDVMQDKYFVIESYDQLYESIPEIRTQLEKNLLA